MHSNVDPLSRNPAYITLVKISDEWEENLSKDYQKDPFDRRIIKELEKIQEEGEAARQRMIQRNNKKFKSEKAADKAQEMDKDITVEKDKSMDKIERKDKEKIKDGQAVDKAVAEEYIDSMAVDKAIQEGPASTDSSSPLARNDATPTVPLSQSQPVASTPTSRQFGQKSGDPSGTAISPTATQKATSSGHSLSKSSESKDSPAYRTNVDRSPKEVDVDGKETIRYRKEAEPAYANMAEDENDEEIDGLELPDDMPVEIALDEALDEATEEVHRDGVVEPVLDSGRTDDQMDEQLDGLASEEKKWDEFVDTQKNLPTTITDGTFTLIGKTLFFTERRKGELRLCIPESMVEDVLRQNHDDIGHPGIRKTYLSISNRYYIRRLSTRVRQYVNNCSVCQTSKPTNEQLMGKLFPIETTEPNHTLSLDFITGLPLSEGKYNALLTVTDKLTKAIRLIPCTTETSAEDTARLFLDYCYPIFGLPVKLISDRDARFTSRF